MKKKLPRLKTDKQATVFLRKDLSAYLHGGNFSPSTFEFAPKDKTVTVRVSTPLLDALKQLAKKRGISYQKLLREAIEHLILAA